MPTGSSRVTRRSVPRGCDGIPELEQTTADAEINDCNRNLIEEFRANDGQVTGPFEGAPLLLPGEQLRARARAAEGEERDRLDAQQEAKMPAFTEYRQPTDRVIPVVVLKRLDTPPPPADSAGRLAARIVML